MKNREDMIVQIGGEHYRLRYIDPGFPHPEDRGLWRAVKVQMNAAGVWFCCDDDDYMITPDRLRITARESGWELRRENA